MRRLEIETIKALMKFDNKEKNRFWGLPDEHPKSAFSNDDSLWEALKLEGRISAFKDVLRIAKK